jgi:hypothetical protein
MPKGDRLKLKADPEDGTTPIANLLLEAVAMAKLSGQEKGAILYLWRQTYGWAGLDKKRLKECKLTLSEWGKALDITRFRASDILADLTNKNIFLRRTADQWGGYYYRLNTNIASWNSNTINLAKLAESVKIADFGDVTPNATVSPADTVTKNDTEQLHKTVTPQLQRTTHPTLYKEILNKDKEIRAIKTSPLGEDTQKVFALLDKERGYRPTKRKAEAASIIRMLKSGYTPEQITTTWRTMKKREFYKGKELFMMTVESQVGAVLKEQGQSAEENPDKFIQGKYGHMVQR